jgi:hypothetical protein
MARRDTHFLFLKYTACTQSYRRAFGFGNTYCSSSTTINGNTTTSYSSKLQCGSDIVVSVRAFPHRPTALGSIFSVARLDVFLSLMLFFRRI